MDVVPYFSVQVSGLLGRMQIYIRVSGRNRRTCHNTCNHASIDGFCLTRDKLTLFSTNTCLIDGTKTQRYGSEIVNCNRLFSLAHQDCTTLGTSRKTVRNGRYPENSKRKLQQKMMGSARAQHNTQNPYKNSRHTTLVFMLCYCCRWVAFKSSKNCTCPLDHERTRDRNNWWNSSHIFTRSHVLTLGTNARLHPGVRSQLTHLPQHMHSRLNRCSLSHQ